MKTPQLRLRIAACGSEYCKSMLLIALCLLLSDAYGRHHAKQMLILICSCRLFGTLTLRNAAAKLNMSFSMYICVSLVIHFLVLVVHRRNTPSKNRSSIAASACQLVRFVAQAVVLVAMIGSVIDHLDCHCFHIIFYAIHAQPINLSIAVRGRSRGRCWAHVICRRYTAQARLWKLFSLSCS